MTFHYLTVLCMSTTGHVYDISLPDSLCMSTTGHVYDISLPDSFVYVYYRSCILDFTAQHCMSTTEYVPKNSGY